MILTSKNKKFKFIVILAFIVNFGIYLFPIIGVNAHGGSPDAPNAFVFQGQEGLSFIDLILVLIGVLVFAIIIVLGIGMLLKKQIINENPTTYIEKINLFGRNARLYILHIQGMSLTYGVRTVLFNIYLYFIFADGIFIFGQEFTSLAFIGTILAIGALVAGLVSPFAGIIVDRIGKKWSFIMGDFIGALTILVVIIFVNPFIILTMQIIRSAVMSVHSIAEGPFIYEQSSPIERVHLFSVASGMNTLASMSGNLIGGMVPVLFAFILYRSISLPTQSVILVIQIGLLISVMLWLGSLIPALYLKEKRIDFSKNKNMTVSARLSFRNVEHWPTLIVFAISSIFVGLGAGMFIQFFALFFYLYYDAASLQIGVLFAIGAFFIALGNFISPIIAERFGKVDAIVGTRFLSIPFLVLLPFAFYFNNLISITPFFIAGVFYLFRAFFQNATGPTESALAMEVVTDQERTTMEALREAGSSFFSAIGYFIGGYLMGQGEFVIPFIGAGLFYLLAVSIFWLYFRNNKLIIKEMTSRNQLAPAD